MTSTLPRTEERSGTLRGERKGWVEQAALVAFIAVPFVAFLAAVPVAWGGWLDWSDALLSFVFYAVAGHGITLGFHRYLTHGSFKAKRPLRIGLTIAGSMAVGLLHHVTWSINSISDPTCARTGVLPGQVDSGARVIQRFEAFDWAYDARWPRQERLDARRAS
jgi:fatty-acid desaturase